MKKIKSKKMKNGIVAYLTNSGRYYCRQYPSPENIQRIDYYTLKGEKIELAKAVCPKCGDTIQSQMCGDFKICKCEKSFVDTDRWFPERHRYGGLVANQIIDEVFPWQKI